ncbi:MAG: iron-containing alcohol dehydrogenase [Thermosulfidibacteraceae bacterium]|jgi:alcohol dehydrogenase YqhD (iron-dependent ADH family)
MLNFVYFNPTKVYFGKNILDKLPKELSKYGKKVLFVYGQSSIKRIGLYDRIIDLLKDFEIIEHGGVKPNPVLTHTREGIKKAKEHKVDVILAVGGGSVIDEAKAIAIGALSDRDVWDYFEGKAIVEKALPIITVLTMVGTGSEMNSGFVITNEEKKAKFGFRAEPVFPKVSFLDPTLTFTIPPDQTAYGAVDAFTHVSEVYWNKTNPDVDITNGIMESIMKSIVKWSKVAVLEPGNYRARAELMWCSSLALSGITWCGVGGLSLPAHMIEHSLSALYDIAHGAGLAIVTPGWMKYMKEKRKTTLLQFAKNVFSKDSVDEGILAFENWLKEIGCPTRLSEVNIPEKDIPEIAKNAYELAKVWNMAEEYPVETIEEILKLCL